MKKLIILIATFMMVSSIQAAKKLDLKEITSGSFAASYVSGVNPIEGTDLYASISKDGKQIVSYSFKTGKQVAVLFDAEACKAPFQTVNGYVLSPDGKRMLVLTKRKSIYRRSFTAEYFIYDLAGKSLFKLSEGENQQVATWSPDSRHVAFVRENNLFITDGKKEVQVTTDGKFNEVINGIPDWVNEEEFGFNKAFAWNADGTALSWIRYDESKVKTYSLQLFCGQKPALSDNTDYPGEYSYKYPKAGQDNSVVSLWSYDVKNQTTARMNVPLATDGYIPRLKPAPDAKSMIAFTLNRHQDELNLYSFNPFTGEAQLLIKESVPKYVKEEVVEWTYVGNRYILLPSDRDGFMHLYLYDIRGKLIKQVEKGDYEVTDVYGMNEKTGDIFSRPAC